MKKLAILSPLVLLATTALAQDSTCILQPSCSQLGYTSAEADCGSAKVLRCPFDVSQVACLSGGSSGSGGGGDNYNPNDPNNELEDAVIFEINIADTSKKFGASVSGGTVIADCGNGLKLSSVGSVTCEYSEVGKYIVKFSGDFTELSLNYYSSYDLVYRIIKLDKTGITKMYRVCGAITIGVVPPLPSTLVDATSMFYNCTKIQSIYPKLPDTLEVADYMFYFSAASSAFSGTVELPSSLKSAQHMFTYNYNLKEVPGMENTQLTNGSYMFNYCRNLTGNIPDLSKTSLTNGSHMFGDCENLTGFADGFKFPTSLTNANRMFDYCRNLTGNPPPLPSQFNKSTCASSSDGPCYDTFAYTQITKDTSTWPSGAW